MPRYRDDIAALKPPEVGRPIEEVARDIGLGSSAIVKLTANESPEGPFPGVIEAATAALADSNRYPDNDLWDLSHALAAELGIERSNLLFGNGSTALVADILSAVSESGTNTVYGWPGFVMYRFAAVWAGAKFVEVPLNERFELDLEAMAEAIDGDTRCVILCNPNNPTGTITSADDVESFVDEISDEVMVLVDEAYFEFVSDVRYRSAIPLALRRENVVVLRTFSKIFSLAAHRVGYAIGLPSTLAEVRKAQQPMTVNTVGQAAALASLGQPDELRRRAEANSASRHHLVGALTERGLDPVESHTNFILFRTPSGDPSSDAARLAHHGVVVRPIGDAWMRVTVGSSEENRRFVGVLDGVLEEIG